MSNSFTPEEIQEFVHKSLLNCISEYEFKELADWCKSNNLIGILINLCKVYELSDWYMELINNY